MPTNVENAVMHQHASEAASINFTLTDNAFSYDFGPPVHHDLPAVQHEIGNGDTVVGSITHRDGTVHLELSIHLGEGPSCWIRSPGDGLHVDGTILIGMDHPGVGHSTDFFV